MKNEQQTYIIAEAGVNHNGSLEMAVALIEAAASAGANAVKFQTFRTEQLVTRMAPKAEYQKRHTDGYESQYQMLKKLELNEQAHFYLYEQCKRNGVDFLSTPFDNDSLDLLTQRLNVSRLKISSGDLTNAPLLYKAAIARVPIILSTGMSNLGEVEDALSVLAFGYLYPNQMPSLKHIRQAYAKDEAQQSLRQYVVLLHCTTEYPTPYEEVNLRVMDTLNNAFGLPVGYSDHTQGISVPIAAVARGACMIEKHFTLDRSLPGPDHQASLEPRELKQMVDSIREIEMALGSARKHPVSSEWKNKDIARKSLIALQPIQQGELFTANNIICKRPGNGISPLYYWDMLGQKALKSYDKDELIEL